MSLGATASLGDSLFGVTGGSAAVAVEPAGLAFVVRDSTEPAGPLHAAAFALPAESDLVSVLLCAQVTGRADLPDLLRELVNRYLGSYPGGLRLIPSAPGGTLFAPLLSQQLGRRVLLAPALPRRESTVIPMGKPIAYHRPALDPDASGIPLVVAAGRDGVLSVYGTGPAWRPITPRHVRQPVPTRAGTGLVDDEATPPGTATRAGRSMIRPAEAAITTGWPPVMAGYVLEVATDRSGIRIDGRLGSPSTLAAAVSACPGWRHRPVVVVHPGNAPEGSAADLLYGALADRLGVPVIAGPGAAVTWLGQLVTEKRFRQWLPRPHGTQSRSRTIRETGPLIPPPAIPLPTNAPRAVPPPSVPPHALPPPAAPLSAVPLPANAPHAVPPPAAALSVAPLLAVPLPAHRLPPASAQTPSAAAETALAGSKAVSAAAIGQVAASPDATSTPTAGAEASGTEVAGAAVMGPLGLDAGTELLRLDRWPVPEPYLAALGPFAPSGALNTPAGEASAMPNGAVARIPFVDLATQAAPGDRNALRDLLGGQYDAHSRTVTRILAEQPGLRAPGRHQAHDMAAALVALRVYCSGGQSRVNGELRRPAGPAAAEARILAWWAAFALRNMPTILGPVFRLCRGDRSSPLPAYQAGTELVEPAFVDVFTARRPGIRSDSQGCPAIEYVIWARSARRLDPLGFPTTALFAPATRFRVLAVDEADGEPARVYLREIAPRAGREGGSGEDPRSADERGLERLRRAGKAAGAEADPGSGPPPDWPIGIDDDGRIFTIDSGAGTATADWGQ